jgi:hypothetical protein
MPKSNNNDEMIEPRYPGAEAFLRTAYGDNVSSVLARQRTIDFYQVGQDVIAVYAPKIEKGAIPPKHFCIGLATVNRARKFARLSPVESHLLPLATQLSGKELDEVASHRGALKNELNELRAGRSGLFTTTTPDLILSTPGLVQEIHLAEVHVVSSSTARALGAP